MKMLRVLYTRVTTSFVGSYNRYKLTLRSVVNGNNELAIKFAQLVNVHVLEHVTSGQVNVQLLMHKLRAS